MRTGTHKPKLIKTVHELREYTEGLDPDMMITEAMSFTDGMEVYTAVDSYDGLTYLMMQEYDEDCD